MQSGGSMGSSTRFVRVLLGTTSSAALVAAGLPVLALSIAAPAAAGCTLVGGPDVSVTCTDEFDATLTYFRQFNDLVLSPETSVETNLAGNDEIILTDALSDSILRVRDARVVDETVLTRDRFDMGAGDDIVFVDSGTLDGTILGGTGNDIFEVFGRSEPGTDIPFVSFNGQEGDDAVVIGPGGRVGILRGASGNDSFRIAGRVTNGGEGSGFLAAISGGADDDEILIDEGANIIGLVSGDGGNDTITMTGGSVSGVAVLDPEIAPAQINFGISGDRGDDTITMTGGTVAGFIFGGNGDDVIEVSGGIVGDPDDRRDIAGVVGYSGSDFITISNGAIVDGFVIGDGDFIIDPTDPESELFPPVDPGNDTIVVDGGTVTGAVMAGGGDDVIVVSDGVIGNPLGGDSPFATPFPGSREAADIGDVRGNDGNDEILIEGGTIFGKVGGDAGNDRIAVTGGSIAGDVDGGTGDDLIDIVGGTVGGDLRGGEGDDELAVSGGTVAGRVDGGEGVDRFAWTGGRIGGTIANTEQVVIDGIVESAEAPLPQIDIEGIDVDVAVSDTRFQLGEGGGSNFNLSGVDTFSASNSRFRLMGDQEVEFLNLAAETFMEAFGTTRLNSRMGGRGNLSIDNSTLSMINGRTNDRLAVNDLRVNGATIGIDVNPLTARSDRIDVDGTLRVGPGVNSRVAAAFDATPTNTILVNFTRTPQLGQTSVVPIIALTGTGVDQATEDRNFVAESLQANDLIDLTLLSAPDGSLFLRTAPNTPAIADASPAAPSNQAAASQNVNVVQDVVTELADTGTGFAAPRAGRVELSPTFAVFSMGQAGYAYHDGFDVSPGGGDTPSFHTTNFSVVAAGELDASAEFGLEDIGVKISGFGGYTSTDVRLGRDANGLQSTGDNDSGLFGASVLVSKIQGEGNLNYALASAAGFFGSTDVFLASTVSSGDYGTQGFIVSGKVGRNMPVSDRVRFDLRAGLAYTAFYGDSFTDTAGIRYGDSRVSYGLVSFEPGLSTAVPMGDLVLSPFVRGTFQYRIGYDNTAKVNDVRFDFDDNDWLVGAQIGANTNVTENVTIGALVDGRTSGDEYALLGKLSVKFTIPRR